MSSRLHLHSFWTRPCFKNEAARQTEDIVIWDYEMVTWLASALQARRHGRIRLITDSRGLKFAKRTGIDWVYNDGISTELDDIPVALNPQLFWAASKLYALKHVDEPVISMDTDALFWRPFEASAPVMALHADDLRWPWYARNRERYAKMGFDGEGWDWDLDPYTTGILFVESPSTARAYATTAIDFMLRCSLAAATEEGQIERYGDAMLFAEQRLLPMCLGHQGLKVVPIAERDPTAFLLRKNPLCMHLWSSKAGYRSCMEARRAYLQWLIAFIEAEHPKALETLAAWNLDTESFLARETSLPIPPVVAGVDLDLTIEISRGSVTIADVNVDAYRRAVSGGLVLPGELVKGEGEAKFELRRRKTGGKQLPAD